MKIGIVGGGIMGISLGYFLAKNGVQIEIFEGSSDIGGLAGPLLLKDETAVDRFYHAILSSDNHLNQLCTELKIADELRFRETKMGFYYDGNIHSMNNIVEFLKFPPLNWIDRFRLGLTVLAAQFVRDWHRLESISVEEWLLRWSGRNTYQNIWRPLLKAKFDGGFDDVPATWIWSRLVRMKSTRDGANQKEEAGHLIGGYITLLNAMEKVITASGGKVHLNTLVNKIVINEAEARGLQVGEQLIPFDAVVATVQSPIFNRLIPDASQDYRDKLASQEYLGIICPILVMARPLTGYWTLNITDDSIPFTGIIETTTYIDPKYVGGHHLIYLPKYTAPGSAYQNMPDDEIQKMWLEQLECMLPAFDRGSLRDFIVNRSRYVEPLHGLNKMDQIPTIDTPIKNLFLATTAQIYPDLTNGESVSRHARQAAEFLLKDLKPPLATAQIEPAVAGITS